MPGIIVTSKVKNYYKNFLCVYFLCNLFNKPSSDYLKKKVITGEHEISLQVKFILKTHVTQEYILMSALSFPRKWESIFYHIFASWIPAFAGMTLKLYNFA